MSVPGRILCPECGTEPVWKWSDGGYCKRHEVRGGGSSAVAIDLDKLEALIGEEATHKALEGGWRIYGRHE